jgi:magnesium transporter
MRFRAIAPTNTIGPFAAKTAEPGGDRASRRHSFMPKKGNGRATAKAKHRGRIDQSLHVHTRPGSILIPPGAEDTILRVTCYGPDRLVDKPNCTLAQLRELRGKYPVMWIDATGLGDAATIEELGDCLGLHRLALEDMVTVPQRSKVEEYPAHLCAVTQIPTYGDELETEQVSIFVGKGFVLSWRERPGPEFDIVRKRLQVPAGVTRSAGVDYLLYALLDAVIDSYFPVLERLGEVLDELDDRIEAEYDSTLIPAMSDIRHDVRQVRRIVWPLRDAVDDLVRSPPEIVTQETLIHLRDCHDHAVAIMDTLENYRDAGSDLRDYYATAISNRMNEIMKVLTIISTIFMPLSFIAGVYGMNFDREASKWSMPELGWPYGYVFALGLMAAVAAGQLYYFVRNGWIGGGRRRSPAAPSTMHPKSR